jgi:hypothetical protein
LTVSCLCVLFIEVAHEAALKAQDKKTRETQQHVADAMEREREKLKRTVALQTQDHKAESGKESRRLDKQWQKVCGDFQKALGCEQVQVVRLQLELVRVLQAAREKEETLQRQASDALHECTVSTSFFQLLSAYLYTLLSATISFYQLLSASISFYRTLFIL